MSDEPSEPKGPDLAAGRPLDDLTDGQPLLGHVEGEAVILVRRGNEAFAVGATCSHYGGPLAEGLVVGDTVRCPWHHACFSLRTGEALRAPALKPVDAYAVSIAGGRVTVQGKEKTPGTVRPRARAGATPHSVGIVGAGAAGNGVPRPSTAKRITVCARTPTPAMSSAAPATCNASGAPKPSQLPVIQYGTRPPITPGCPTANTTLATAAPVLVIA